MLIENEKGKLELLKKSLPIFTILNNESRQKIIIILARKGLEGSSVDDITKDMNLSRPTVSHHLKLLRQSSIVSIRKVGTTHFYFLTLKNAVEELKKLITMLESSCQLV